MTELGKAMMTNKEFEKAIHDIDTYLGEDFNDYVISCINGEIDENEIFDIPVVFECCEKARKANLHQLKGRAGIYLFVMNSDYYIDEEKINYYANTKGANLNFTKPRVLKKGSVFYVGSNNSSIYARIGQHLNSTSGTLSFASNYRHFMCERLTIFGLPIKKNIAELLKNYEMMKAFLLLTENSLHKYWSPHAGTAR